MNKPTFTVINSKSSEEAEIYLYGNIGRYWRVDTEIIIQKLEQLRGEGLQKITFYVNSNGGEVPQGLLLFNYLNRNSFQVTFIVDGIAASMAALLLFVPGATIKIARYAKLMLHSVQGIAVGTVSEIRGYADNMEDWQNDLVDIIAKRTGISVAKVKGKWFDEKDHWINANDAKNMKLVDEVIDGKSGIKPAQNTSNVLDVMQYYESQLFNLITNIDNMKLTNEFAQVLNLTGQPSEESILEAVRNMTKSLSDAQTESQKKDDEITDLKKQIEDNDKAKIKALVDQAINEKKIGEDMRDTYTRLATLDYDGTKTVLDAMRGVVKVKNQLATEEEEDDTHKGWNFVDFQKKDPAALAAMKENNPDQYKALYKKQFGSEPKL